MHELSLCTSIIKVIEGLTVGQSINRVTVVALEVGALANVELHALQFGFIAAARGTIAEGAQLQIDATPARAWCPRCAVELTVTRRYADCPTCGAPVMSVEGDDRLCVKHLEVE